jgi:hypothetical protein
VGVDDVMSQVLWTLYFIEDQGYNIDDNILYQDIKSSNMLQTNRRGSSGKRTRHITVRYFFIADQVKSKEIRIQSCTTGIVIAYYFTKPLQGLIFGKLRDMIMGNTDIALPTYQASITTDQTSGIPAVSTQQESRSLLGKEVEINPSPTPLNILSGGGPPASGPTCKNVCDGAHTCTPACVSASARNFRIYEPHVYPYHNKGKHTAKATLALSWADVARKGQTRDRKEMGSPHSFYEI